MVIAESDGQVLFVDAMKIRVKYQLRRSESDSLVTFDSQGVKEYELVKFFRTKHEVTFTP